MKPTSPNTEYTNTNTEYTKLYSEILNDNIAIARTPVGRQRAIEAHAGIVVYTPREIDLIATEDECGLRLIHLIKKILGGTVVK